MKEIRMDKRFYRLIAFLPIIFFIIFTNYYIDPANIYHNKSREMAEEMLRGRAVYSISGNMDERMFKYELLKGTDKAADCIAVGPSMSYGIDTEDTGEALFYNLSTGGSDYYDILAQFGMMEAFDKLPQRIIFCVEQNFFDENLYGPNTRHDNLMPYSEYMLKILEGEEPAKPELSKVADLKRMFRQLVSVTYFQSAIGSLERNGAYFLDGNMRWGIVDENFDREKNNYFEHDGSLVHSFEAENRDGEYVKESVREFDIASGYSKGQHISEQSRETFKKLMEYLKSRGTGVTLFICPLSPSLWEKVSEDGSQYYVLYDMEELAGDVAREYGFKLTGSLDPGKYGLKDSDYYDAKHIKDDKLSQCFDLKK